LLQLAAKRASAHHRKKISGTIGALLSSTSSARKAVGNSRHLPSPSGDRVVVAAADLVGADGFMGVFMMSVANPGVWTRFGTNLPNVGAYDLAYDASRDLLAVALVGRGVWELQNVTLTDQAPVTRCRNVPVSADASCHATITAATVDNGSSDPDADRLSCSLDATGPFSPGMVNVKLTCTDPGGAGSACNATVTVQDVTPPTFTSVPLDIMTTTCVQPALGTPVASDNCGGSVAIRNDAPAKFPPGTTLVTWTATDTAGNRATATQRVTMALSSDANCCPAGSNVIRGTSNNDTLNGTSGSDCILGFGGQDTINGNGGNDYLSGGDGDDVVNGGDGNDVVFGGTGQDRITGGNGDDYLNGGDGDDTVNAGPGKDTLRGGQGQDHLYGEDDNDRIYGEGGDDTLDGGNGNDDLVGGGLHDTCTGGAGTNTYATCESPGTNSCADGVGDGTETDVDCGGACPRCVNGKHCTSGDDCQAGECAAGVCTNGSGGSTSALVAASFSVTTDFGSGYCVALNVTNNAAIATTNWSALVNIPGATVYQSWNATFSGTGGSVTVSPSFVSNRSIDPVTTDSSVGFCANRSVPSSGSLPGVTSITPTF